MNFKIQIQNTLASLNGSQNCFIRCILCNVQHSVLYFLQLSLIPPQYHPLLQRMWGGIRDNQWEFWTEYWTLHVIITDISNETGLNLCREKNVFWISVLKFAQNEIMLVVPNSYSVVPYSHIAVTYNFNSAGTFFPSGGFRGAHPVRAPLQTKISLISWGFSENIIKILGRCPPP